MGPVLISMMSKAYLLECEARHWLKVHQGDKVNGRDKAGMRATLDKIEKRRGLAGRQKLEQAMLDDIARQKDAAMLAQPNHTRTGE